MASMNFAVRLALQSTAAFKKGLNAVKKELNSFKNSFLGMASAMGAGFGLEKLFSSIYDSTVKLSSANAVLRNVSKSQEELATSQKFLNRISTEYKQNIIGLTMEFAQFKASADACGVSLKDQYKIYEALTRAAAYYHLSAEQVTNMQMAITQMMSKGKVTAEELRRQLGNVLPGAFGLMAQAMGISTAEMEDMMRKGELLSAEALPKFADKLNEITQDIDLDSLQLSINEVGNAWAHLVSTMELEGTFSSILNTASSTLGFIERHLTTIGNIIKSVIVGSVAKWATTLAISVVGAWKKINAQINAGVAKTVLLKSLTGNWVSLLVGLVTGLATFFGTSLFSLFSKDDEEGLKNTKNTLAEISDKNNAISNQAELLLGQIKDANDNLDKRKALLKQLNELLGLNGNEALNEKSTYEEINDLVRKRIQLLGNQNKINALTEDSLNKQSEIEEIKTKIAEKNANKQSLLREIKNYTGDTITAQMRRRSKYGDIVEIDQEIKDLQNDIKNLEGEINKNTDAITQLEMSNQSVSAIDQIEKIKSAYNSELFPLNNSKSKGVINDKEFDKKLLNLINQTLDKLGKVEGGLDTEFANSLINEKARLDNVLKKDYNSSGVRKAEKSPTEKLKEEITKYDKSLNELKSQLANEAITQDEYAQKVEEAGDNAYLAMTKIEGFSDILGTLGEEFQSSANKAKEANSAIRDREKAQKDAEYAKELNDIKASKYERDSTFDYKFDADHKNSETLNSKSDAWKKYADQLEDEKEKLEALKEKNKQLRDEEEERYKNVCNSLAEATKNAKSFKEAADLAEINEDIKEYQKNLNKMGYEGLKDGLSDLESIVSAVKEIKEVYQDDDSDYWDRLFANLNLLFKTIDSINSVYEASNAIKAISVALSEAKASATKREAAATMIATAQNSANEASALGEAAANTIATQAAIAKASATGTEAVAEGASSVAKIPYVGAALAVAAIGAITAALMASFGKFEKGGIVGGYSTRGDKNFVRANSGEMILTKAQQGTLFNMLNGKGGIGGNVDFRIRGTELIGVINNTNGKRKALN